MKIIFVWNNLNPFFNKDRIFLDVYSLKHNMCGERVPAFHLLFNFPPNYSHIQFTLFEIDIKPNILLLSTAA